MRSIPFSVLGAAVLAACASLVEPTPKPVPTLTQVPATLPPLWTPTPAEDLPTPAPSPTPEVAGLQSGGPWLLYCDEGREYALINADGSGGHTTEMWCSNLDDASGATGFVLREDALLQLPTMDHVRTFDPLIQIGFSRSEWSQNGEYLAVQAGIRPAEMWVYDVAFDRLKLIADGSADLVPLGWSPDGQWLVHIDEPPSPGPGRTTRALSPDGNSSRDLFPMPGSDIDHGIVEAWLSNSTFVQPKQIANCFIELLHVDIEAQQARAVFAAHNEAAIDPATGMILLNPGECGIPERSLILLRPESGWEPEPVSLSSEWGVTWERVKLDWLPELNRFTAIIDGTGTGANPSARWTRLITFTLEGTAETEIVFSCCTDPSFRALYPSPDGSWLLFQADPPHGTRLYDAKGVQVHTLEDRSQGSGAFSGPRWVQWAPEGDSFFVVFVDGTELYRASRSGGWQLVPIDQSVERESPLHLVYPPKLPFWEPCGFGELTRLRLGDRVVVSSEPLLPNNLRFSPGLGGEVVDTLGPEAQALIDEGPACSDGLVWWLLLVDETGVSGWATEGDNVEDGAWLLRVED